MKVIMICDDGSEHVMEEGISQVEAEALAAAFLQVNPKAQMVIRRDAA